MRYLAIFLAPFFAFPCVFAAQEKEKMTGEFLLDTFDLFQISQQRIRIKAENANRGFLFGGVFAKDQFTDLKGLTSDSLIVAARSRPYRWIKGLAGYDLDLQPGQTGLRKRGFVRQLYIGNYRVGFLEGSMSGRNLGFIPDLECRLGRRSCLNPYRKRIVPLKGLATRLQLRNVSACLYYSKNQVPLSLPSLIKGSVSGEDSASSSAVIENALDVEVYGAYLGAGSIGKIHGGIFWNQVAAWSDLPGKLTFEYFLNQVLGVHLRGGGKRVSYRLVVSRARTSLVGLRGRNSAFWCIRKSLDRKTDVFLEGRRQDSGFANPVGRIYSGTIRTQFFLRLRRKIKQNVNGSLDYRYGKGKERSRRCFQYRLIWRRERKYSFDFLQAYRDSGATAINNSGRFRTRARLNHRSGSRITNFSCLEVTARKRRKDALDLTSLTISWGIDYRFNRYVRFLGEARFYDPGLFSPRGGNQTQISELWFNLNRGLQLKLRWRNRYRMVKNTEPQGVVNEHSVQSQISTHLRYSW